MAESYFTLKRKLQDLGYTNTLPEEAVPLVECVLADLIQTTRSLQHYMDLAKEALLQRDSLMMEAEPYKCDNAKLIQENNKLHKQVMKLQEDNLKLTKEHRRKMKALSEELTKKDDFISKLQYDIRDLSLRGLCADTQSSRNKSKRKDDDNCLPRICGHDRTSAVTINNKELTELKNKIHLLQEKNDSYCDQIVLLQNQIEHRDNEIIRLNMLLEGGRPITAIHKDFCSVSSSERIQTLMKDLHELETINDNLKKEVDTALEKQHEAMSRALNLADKNKKIEEELQKVDMLALRVEEDCNNRLSVMTTEIRTLQTRLEGLTMKNAELTKQLVNQGNTTSNLGYANDPQYSLSAALREIETLNKEIKDLLELNKCLQDKILTLFQRGKNCDQGNLGDAIEKIKNLTKSELQILLENERKTYEKHVQSLQEKMTEVMDSFNIHMLKCKNRDSQKVSSFNANNPFTRDLHVRLCESEQTIMMLRKENEELKRNENYLQENNKQNFKDIISQLNSENAELSKENIALSRQLSQYNNINPVINKDTQKYDVKKLNEKIDQLTNEIQLLKKDNFEYNQRYKEAFELSEKLKRDLVFKQKQLEHLEEENCSYKMSTRNGQASTDHLKDECNFLREQLKKMQSDVIREKTFANQIKNIQIETERSSTELQNELLGVQKKFSLSKDTVDSLERKCKELQIENVALRNEKSVLIDNIKKLDQERDKLVLELDNKTENISMLEHKIQNQSYEMSKLENDYADLKRKLSASKVSEHKVTDLESQITFLNGEILRNKQQLDSAIIENKHLQNSLADANGTLKLTRISYDKALKEVNTLKDQLQHYVAEIRRIEEMLSQKEAERADMLEHFASLSVEANILENTNHSLENESASKTMQLQTYVTKIQSLEEQLLDKENVIESQASRIAALTCEVSKLQSEVKLMSEEKAILEQNISYLKQMCNNLQSEHSNTVRDINQVDTELKLHGNKIKTLSSVKLNLERDNEKLKESLDTTEKLLSNARKEIIQLKLALQDATSETKSLQESVNRLSRTDAEDLLTAQEFILPLTLDEIHEVSQEDDECSTSYLRTHKSYSKYTHSGTL